MDLETINAINNGWAQFALSLADDAYNYLDFKTIHDIKNGWEQFAPHSIDDAYNYFKNETSLKSDTLPHEIYYQTGEDGLTGRLSLHDENEGAYSVLIDLNESRPFTLISNSTANAIPLELIGTIGNKRFDLVPLEDLGEYPLQAGRDESGAIYLRMGNLKAVFNYMLTTFEIEDIEDHPQSPQDFTQWAHMAYIFGQVVQDALGIILSFMRHFQELDAEQAQSEQSPAG